MATTYKPRFELDQKAIDTDPQMAELAEGYANELLKRAQANTRVVVEGMVVVEGNTATVYVGGSKKQLGKKVSAGIVASEFGTVRRRASRMFYRAAQSLGLKMEGK